MVLRSLRYGVMLKNRCCSLLNRIWPVSMSSYSIFRAHCPSCGDAQVKVSARNSRVLGEDRIPLFNVSKHRELEPVPLVVTTCDVTTDQMAVGLLEGSVAMQYFMPD